MKENINMKTVQIDKEACKEGGGEYKQNGGCDTKGDEKIADKVTR